MRAGGVAVRWRVVLSVTLALGIGAFLQWGSRDLGRRDNGDWRRYSRSFATTPIGFETPGEAGASSYRPDRETGWSPLWRRKSPLEPPCSRLDTGTSFLLWLPGWALSAALLDGPILDLRLLGLPARLAILGLVALLGATLARRAPPGRLWDVAIVAGSIAIAAAQCDASVLSYAGTFFRETASQVFALATLALLALPPASLVRWRWILAAALAATMVSAPVHALLLLPVVGVATSWEPGVRRRLLLALGLAAIAAVGFDLAATSRGLRRNASFNAFFYGLLPESGNPLEQVRRVGLPDDAVELVGRRAFEPESRELISRGVGPSHFDVLRAGLLEPGALLRLLGKGAGHLGPGAGPPGARAAGAVQRPIAAWEAPWWFANRRLAASGAGALALLAAIVGLAAWALSGSAGEWDAGLARLTLFTAAGAIVEVVGNLLGDGLSGAARHLFLARILFDLSIVLSVLLTLSRVVPPGAPRRAS